MRRLNSKKDITYRVARTDQEILFAKRLCHDVYLEEGYIKGSFPNRIIPHEHDAESTYILAYHSEKAVGTLRITFQHFKTIDAWKGKFFPWAIKVIDLALKRRSVEIGALALLKEYRGLHVSWGLYKTALKICLLHNINYAVIGMDDRALRSIELLGLYVIRIGKSMNFMGSHTTPGIMPIRKQKMKVDSSHSRFANYLAA